MANSGSYIIATFTLGILASLAVGFYALMRESREGTRTVKSLTIRVLLSFSLFFMLLVGWYQGWLHPHGFGEL